MTHALQCQGANAEAGCLNGGPCSAGDPCFSCRSNRRRLHASMKTWHDAEAAFERAYNEQAKRLGIRPGDFRYMRDKHSPAVLRLAAVFVQTGDAWRELYKAVNAASEVAA